VRPKYICTVSLEHILIGPLTYRMKNVAAG